MRYPVISYERILAPDFSVGASLGFGLADDHLMNFNLTPFARWFFGGRQRETLRGDAAGFFIEGNTALYSISQWNSTSRYHNGSWYFDGSYESTFDFGIGLGIGWKFVTRGNWTSEILIGGGRGLANDTGFLRGGLSVGRRF